MNTWRTVAVTDPFYSVVSGPLCEIYPSATDYCKITRINLNFINPGATATGFSLGIGNPAVQGIGLRFSPVLVSLDQNYTGVAPSIQMATSWTTDPTAPALFFRRAAINATTNDVMEMQFVFPSGLSLKPSQSLVLWGFPLPAVSLTSVTIPMFFCQQINLEIDA